jgi:NUMOD4 motif/HNH endonuclease
MNKWQDITLTQEELNNEIWKPFRDTPYMVSNLGRVYSNKKKREVIARKFLGKNYYRVQIVINGSKKNIKVHRMVYAAFNPNFDFDNKKLHVHHLNENIWDNRLQNLQEIDDYTHKSYHKSKEKNHQFHAPIARFNTDGTYIGSSVGLYELQDLGFHGPSVYKTIKGTYKTHADHIFRWNKNFILIPGEKYNVDNLPNKLQNYQQYLF